jgi:hypothetical protein
MRATPLTTRKLAIMSYVSFADTRTAAQRTADREADAQWFKDHADHDVSTDPAPAAQYGADAVAPLMVGSAH